MLAKTKIEQNSKKVRAILEADGYDMSKELSDDYCKELEITYSKTIKNCFNMPKEIGKVVMGLATYESIQSELKILENRKDSMQYLGFSMWNTDLIEYYFDKGTNYLYVYLYTYNLIEKYKKIEKRRLDLICINTTKEGGLES